MTSDEIYEFSGHSQERDKGTFYYLIIDRRSHGYYSSVDNVFISRIHSHADRCKRLSCNAHEYETTSFQRGRFQAGVNNSGSEVHSYISCDADFLRCIYQTATRRLSMSYSTPNGIETFQPGDRAPLQYYYATVWLKPR